MVGLAIDEPPFFIDFKPISVSGRVAIGSEGESSGEG